VKASVKGIELLLLVAAQLVELFYLKGLVKVWSPRQTKSLLAVSFFEIKDE
jgi:hypothetical protein